MRLHDCIYQKQYLKVLCYHLAMKVLTTWNACANKYVQKWERSRVDD